MGCYYKLKAKAVPLHAMEALGGKKVQLLLILDLGTRWVGPRAGLDTETRGITPFVCKIPKVHSM
jgi:hypothetical protein